ncbi:MAG: peptidase inhibitor family I36 protein [Umezawaea sp.]
MSNASAAARDGNCQTNEFCYYWGSGQTGSLSDFTASVADYGKTQPTCYDYKGAGAGKGTCIKNNAASVENNSSRVVRVFFNTGQVGVYQDIPAHSKRELNGSLIANNASHKFL